MSKINEPNFKLMKFKKTNSGIEAVFNETIVLGNDVTTVNEVVKKSKDDPHPELQKAINKFDEIVRYDEGYSEDVDIRVTGISIFGKDRDVAMVTHCKGIESGMSGGRNSCRIHKDSESFEMAGLLFTLIDKLAHEVYLFFEHNKRSQLQLFGSEPTEDEQKKPAESAA